MNAASLPCSVRWMPAGVTLAENLHHAEAQGFAAAWNRLEGSATHYAVVVVAGRRGEIARRQLPRPRAAAGGRRRRAG